MTVAQDRVVMDAMRAYRTDFEIFGSWAKERGVIALPAAPEAVAAFLAAEAERGIKPSTISRRVAWPPMQLS